jgi:hypothetical protein
MEEERKSLVNDSPIFSKILKIQENQFKTKQERDLPLFTQLKNTPIFNSQHLYNNYINNTKILVLLA